MISLDKTLTQTVDAYGNAFAEYVTNLFSGEDDQVKQLEKIIAKGGIMDVAVDLNQMTKSTKKLLSAKLIQAAWSVAPEGAGAHPFIL